jgi:hypothetical protein
VVALRARARGQTLLDAVLVVAILLTALAAVLAYGLTPAPGAGRAASAGLPALVESARAIGASSGDGATLAFEQEPLHSAGRNDFDVRVYPARPHPGSSFDPQQPLRTERFAGAFRASFRAGPLAIFISSSGTASYAHWKPGDRTLEREPACTQPLQLLVGGDPAMVNDPPASPSPNGGNGLVWFSMSCDQARLVQF